MPEPGDAPTVDVLVEIQAALGRFDQVFGDRSVQVELQRLRARVDPVALRDAIGALVKHLLATTGPADPVTVRASRADGGIRIDVLAEDGGPTGAPDLRLAAEALAPFGATVVAGPAGGPLVGRITVTAADRSSAPGS